VRMVREFINSERANPDNLEYTITVKGEHVPLERVWPEAYASWHLGKTVGPSPCFSWNVLWSRRTCVCPRDAGAAANQATMGTEPGA
jgi:hypothetical protein